MDQLTNEQIVMLESMVLKAVIKDMPRGPGGIITKYIFEVQGTPQEIELFQLVQSHIFVGKNPNGSNKTALVLDQITGKTKFILKAQDRRLDYEIQLRWKAEYSEKYPLGYFVAVNNKKLGRDGEKFIYYCLVRLYGKNMVRWLNEESESYSPYDIEILDKNGNAVQYIECKTTSKDKKIFYMSHNEWDFFIENRGKYHIYRIHGLANWETDCEVIDDLQDWLDKRKLDKVDNGDGIELTLLI